RGERLERYRALARRAAARVEADEPDTTVSSSIGGAILKRWKGEGAKEVMFYARRHAPLSMIDAAASDPGQSNPFNPRTYSDLATISVSLNSLNEPQVQVKKSALDVAPVSTPGKAASGRTQGSTEGNGANRSRNPEPSTRGIPPGTNLLDQSK